MSAHKDAMNLAGKISSAVWADEQGDGCDISGGLYGTAMSDLVKELAFAVREYCPTDVSEKLLGNNEGVQVDAQ